MENKDKICGQLILLKYIRNFNEQISWTQKAIGFLEQILNECHKSNTFMDITVEDISVRITNQFFSVVRLFKNKNLDLLFMKDGSDIYPDNFFAGIILSYYYDLLINIDDSIQKIMNSLHIYFDEYHKRNIIQNIFSIMGIVKNKKMEESVATLYSSYKEYQEAVEKYLNSDLLRDYLEVVEHHLAIFSENPDAMSPESLVACYHMNTSFALTFARSDLIPSITEIYKKFFAEYNYDSSLLVESSENLFIEVQSELCDCYEYLHMNRVEREKEIMRLQKEYVAELLNDKDISIIIETIGDEDETPSPNAYRKK